MKSNQDMFHNAAFQNPLTFSPRKLKYPTWGKGISSTQSAFKKGEMLVASGITTRCSGGLVVGTKRCFPLFAEAGGSSA